MAIATIPKAKHSLGFVFCALLLLFFWQGARADASKSIIAVAGVGTSSCAEFIQHSKSRPDITFGFMSWAQGLMSGLNTDYIMAGGGSTNLSNHEYQDGWLHTYCSNSPEKPFYAAVLNLYQVLRQEQGLARDERY